MVIFRARAVGVSTHSRPKAAGFDSTKSGKPVKSFNTQPPEGGWPENVVAKNSTCGFNTQPPEGGWLVKAI